MSKYIVLNKQEYIFKNFSLVPIRDVDKFKIMNWRNEQLYHLRQKEKLTKKDQINYFNNIISKLFIDSKPSQILFSFLENDICVGYGGLVHINWHDKNAEISFLMNTSHEKLNFDKYWEIFLEMIEDIAFNDLNFSKIYFYVFFLRPNLYKVLENKIFFMDARLEKHAYFNNKLIDVVIYSKLNKK